MSSHLLQIKDFFTGRFIAEPTAMQEKLLKAKAFLFDWDGVFNKGKKDDRNITSFNEADVLGINLLLLNYYMLHGKLPPTAIILDEMDKAAFTLAKREHIGAVYYNMKTKKDALTHLCDSNNFFQNDVVYFFDDISDLAIAELCGLRVMMGRQANPLLLEFVHKNMLAEYITSADGGNNGLREATELLTGLSERYDDTLLHYAGNSEQYRQYITLRNTQATAFYTNTGSHIILHTPQL